MSEVISPAPAASEPEIFTWRGIRFSRQPPRRDEAYRYESEDFMFAGHLTGYANGQWLASFSHGSYSVEWDKEDALESARLRAIDSLYYLAARFEGLELEW